MPSILLRNLKHFARPAPTCIRRRPPVLSRTMADLAPADDGQSKATPEDLPKLSMAEFREYNRLATRMELFHNWFRQTWNTLYTACTTSRRPEDLSLREFLSLGLNFCDSLETHHSIEEVHVFPTLARKMPAFRQELELLTQHKQIHQGLDKLQLYLEGCKTGQQELRLGEMKEIMDGFGKVLWEHLDDEVKELGAQNMRKYWTIEEMKRLVI